jgi:hypothetical protein
MITKKSLSVKARSCARVGEPYRRPPIRKATEPLVRAKVEPSETNSLFLMPVQVAKARVACKLRPRNEDHSTEEAEFTRRVPSKANIDLRSSFVKGAALLGVRAA